MVPRGIYVASCYLHDNEGSTERNLELLAHLLAKLKAARCPWVLGLDAQQEPQELVKWAAPLLDNVWGKIVNADDATLHPGVGRPKILDYSFVEEKLASAVQKVGTLGELKCQSRDCPYTVRATPHKVTWISLKGQCLPRLKQVLRMPK